MDTLTNRWLLILGIGTVLFGISLFILRVPIRTILIFFALGFPLVLLWLYVDERSRRAKEKIEAISNLEIQPCVCAICRHDLVTNCMNDKCPCCIMLKGDKVVGHSINPLQ
jgi:uncharacterized membrane protein